MIFTCYHPTQIVGVESDAHDFVVFLLDFDVLLLGVNVHSID